MLTIRSPALNAGGAACSRRDFMRVGALSLGGATLADLLRVEALAGQGASIVRDKAIVVLFLSGGASHIETFDPKMTAAAEVRSMTGEATTTLPGVTYGGTFTRLAGMAQRLAVVRSFCHSVGDHVGAISHVLTGGSDRTGKGFEGFSIGAGYTRLRGTNHPQTGLPTYALLTADEVDSQYNSERSRVQRGSTPRGLGQAYAPFDVSGKSDAVRNMQLNVDPRRLDDRQQLLKALDGTQRQVAATGAMDGLDRFNQQAVDVVLGSASHAFDLRKEESRSLARYDTSDILIGHKKFRPSTLGHQMLLARRLCEAGCGFVTIHSAGWDMHADGNNPGIVKGMGMLGESLDRSVSTFLDDVAERGLSDKILLVITGDFGRTPRVNKRGGRDHWANLGALALAGGGLPMGQVIGQSARNADVPAGDPLTPGHLISTIMHTAYDIPPLRLKTGVPREIMQVVENQSPIPQLCS